jgi:hypothetical protein
MLAMEQYRSLVAMESHWLLWKTIVDMKVFGCYGKSLVAMESLCLLLKSTVAMESQWLNVGLCLPWKGTGYH